MITRFSINSHVLCHPFENRCRHGEMSRQRDHSANESRHFLGYYQQKLLETQAINVKFD